jgi:uracil-DNA glycosylase
MDLKQISRVCNTFRGKYKSVLIQSGLTRFLIIILVVGIFSAAFDWMFHFKTFARCCILLGAITGACLMFWWTTILALKKNWTDTQVLSYLDTTEGLETKGILELFELIKAENIQETKTEIGKHFLEEAIDDLNQRLGKLTYSKAIRKSSFLKWFYGLAGILAFIAIIGVVDTERAKIGAIRFINPFTESEWPSRTKIKVFLPNIYTITLKDKDGKSSEFKFDNVRDKNFEITFGSETTNGIPVVDPSIAGKQFKYIITRDEMFVEDLKTEKDTKLNGVKVVDRVPYKKSDTVTVEGYTLTMVETIMSPWSIPQLEAVNVSALVTGEIPSQATIEYTSKATDLVIKEKVNIAKNGNIEYVFPSVKEELTFNIKANDYESKDYTISVIQRPFLKKITADYKYPPYAGVPNQKKESGQLTGIEGTTVTITFESSMELSKAVFNHEEVGKSDLIKVNETTFTKELRLEKNGAYSIELYEKSGFREAKPERFEIKVDPDAKPEIDIIAPGRNLSETKNASIEVAFKAADDFGIKSLGVYYKVGDEKEFKLLSNKITGPIAVGGKKSEVRFDWDFKKMDIPESSVVRYYIYAQDVNPTGNGITKSGEYEIELIKPSVFHQEAILKAKVLLTEGMIAWKNQLEAYKEGQAWVAKAENKVDDAGWQSMVDKQDAAIRAVEAINSHIAVLTDKYERNRMQREFMAVRLNSIITDIKAMTSKEMGVVESKIKDSKPKNDAEAGRLPRYPTPTPSSGRGLGRLSPPSHRSAVAFIVWSLGDFHS